MPARKTPLVNGEYYHVFNRGINKQPIYLGLKDYSRGKNLINYYSYSFPPLRFSKFLKLSNQLKVDLLSRLKSENDKEVDIISFVLMPNHFHLLVKQMKDKGISKFLSNFQNSYTKYFNTKYKKIGPLLQGQFKAVRMEDDEQLLHVSRYIHINPHTSFVVKDLDSLLEYPWSSLPEYIMGMNERDRICNKEIILSHFKNSKDFKIFILDQLDYQRELKRIQHLTLE